MDAVNTLPIKRVITKGYIDTPFLQVHYRSAGRRKQAPRPLVLLHQTASSSAMYERLMGELAGAYWIVAPDTPGFGGTDALQEKGSIALYADVLRAALQHLDIDDCWLFGHHSGASIAVQLAHDHPSLVNKLILSGPPLLTQEQIEGLIPSVSPVVLHGDGRHLMSVWARIRAKDPGAPVALSHREAVLNLHAGVRYPEAYQAVFEHKLADQLAELSCPTMVMAGRQDTIFSSLEPAYRLLKHGTMKVIEQGGTYICDREPQAVAAAIREFFPVEA